MVMIDVVVATKSFLNVPGAVVVIFASWGDGDAKLLLYFETTIYHTE